MTLVEGKPFDIFGALPPEMACHVLRFLDPSEYDPLKEVSDNWRRQIEGYSGSYLPLYRQLVGLLPSLFEREWKAFRTDIDQGFTGGRIAALKYNSQTQTCEIVYRTNDAAYKSVSADQQAENEGADFVVKPVIKKPAVRHTRTLLAKMPKTTTVRVVCTGAVCTFTRRSELGESRRFFAEAAVREAARRFFRDVLFPVSTSSVDDVSVRI